jgi:hypothetical protein
MPRPPKLQLLEATTQAFHGFLARLSPEALRIFARKMIREMERHYQSSGNALFAWRAYGFARDASEPVPEWVLKYFDKAEEALMAPLREDDGPLKEPASAIAGALGLKLRGRGNVYRRFHQEIEKGELLAKYTAALAREGNKAWRAQETLGQEVGCSERTIRRKVKKKRSN